MERPFRCVSACPVAIAIVLVAVAALPATAAPAPSAGLWSQPVPGAVVRPFSAPTSRYGPGHRGADLAAESGGEVRAAGAGVVAFAGSVAGSLHVVVAHPGGLRTSYSFLRRVDVRRGARVARGDTVGIAGGVSDDHPVGGLHFGLRIGDTYVDPMVLFRPPDLARVVHLVPPREGGEPGGASWAVEAFGVARGLETGEPVRGWSPGSGAANHRGTGPFDAVASWLAGGADATSGLARAGVAALAGAGGEARALAERIARFVPGNGAVVDARRALARLVDALDPTSRCTGSAPRADGTGGSGHLLFAVGGLNSSTDTATGATFGLRAQALGYRADEVHWFSYAGEGAAYTRADTYERIHLAALRLAEQLRALARAEPGREVDLVAHSQGGVVVDEFLQHVYRAADPTYPPVGTIVTLSSPHRGAPLATAATRIAESEIGRGALRATAPLGLPPPAAPVLRDLAEDSSTIRGLWEHRLPDQVDFTTIGAVDDTVVPATQVAVPGATEVLVDPAGISDHSAIVDDPTSLAAVRLALEGRAPPCPSVVDAVRGAVEPLVITRLERAAGGVGGAR